MVFMVLLPLAAEAAVYRYVDKDGVVHYTDQPPDKSAKPAKLPPLHTMSPITPVAPTGPVVAPAAPPAVRTPLDDTKPAVPTPLGELRLSMVTPRPDQTFRSAERIVPVTVALDRPLPEGHGLVYFLDDTAQGTEPVRELSTTLTEVERGEHRVSAAVVDASGAEITRTQPVTVHLKPPTVNGPASPRPRVPAKAN